MVKDDVIWGVSVGAIHRLTSLMVLSLTPTLFRYEKVS
jgi:hypothetical protein